MYSLVLSTCTSFNNAWSYSFLVETDESANSLVVRMELGLSIIRVVAIAADVTDVAAVVGKGRTHFLKTDGNQKGLAGLWGCNHWHFVFQPICASQIRLLIGITTFERNFISWMGTRVCAVRDARVDVKMGMDERGGWGGVEWMGKTNISRLMSLGLVSDHLHQLNGSRLSGLHPRLLSVSQKHIHGGGGCGVRIKGSKQLARLVFVQHLDLFSHIR